MVLRIASIFLTLTGAGALLTGLLFWFGYGLELMSLHMLLGILTVVALWVIGVAQAALPGGSWAFAIIALLVGILTLFLGLYQSTLLVGSHHWLVQVLHVALGVITIGLGHMAAARTRRAGSLT